MQKSILKPAADLTVIDPTTGRALPAEGAEVVVNKYWTRRILDGDVVVVQTPKKQSSKKES